MKWNIKEIFSDKSKEIYLHTQQFLYQENTPAQVVFFLEKGILALFKRDFRKKDFFLNFVEPEHWIGLAAMQNRIYPNSIQALTPVKLYQIPIENLKEQLELDFSLRLQVIQAMCKEVSLVESKLANAPQKTIKQRLAKLILEINKIQEADYQAIEKDDFSYTLIELAELMGIPQKNTSKTLHEMDNEGWISKNASNQVKILNRPALEKLALS